MNNSDFDTHISPAQILAAIHRWEPQALRIDAEGIRFMHRGQQVHVRLVWVASMGDEQDAWLEPFEWGGESRSPTDALNGLLWWYRNPPLDAEPVLAN